MLCELGTSKACWELPCVVEYSVLEPLFPYTVHIPLTFVWQQDVALWLLLFSSLYLLWRLCTWGLCTGKASQLSLCRPTVHFLETFFPISHANSPQVAPPRHNLAKRLSATSAADSTNSKGLVTGLLVTVRGECAPKEQRLAASGSDTQIVPWDLGPGWAF